VDAIYWVNPDFIFNGDRLAFVQEWFREGSPAAKEYEIRKSKKLKEAQQPELELGLNEAPIPAPENPKSGMISGSETTGQLV
jgi:hypothetical protein